MEGFTATRGHKKSIKKAEHNDRAPKNSYITLLLLSSVWDLDTWNEKLHLFSVLLLWNSVDGSLSPHCSPNKWGDYSWGFSVCECVCVASPGLCIQGSSDWCFVVKLGVPAGSLTAVFRICGNLAAAGLAVLRTINTHNIWPAHLKLVNAMTKCFFMKVPSKVIYAFGTSLLIKTTDCIKSWTI